MNIHRKDAKYAKKKHKIFLVKPFALSAPLR